MRRLKVKVSLYIVSIYWVSNGLAYLVPISVSKYISSLSSKHTQGTLQPVFAGGRLMMGTKRSVLLVGPGPQ